MSKDKSYNILLRSQRWITTQQNLKRARNYTCEQCNTKINTGRKIGEFGYTRQEAESMVDRCEFHGFIENIGTETKTLYKLKTE